MDGASGAMAETAGATQVAESPGLADPLPLRYSCRRSQAMKEKREKKVSISLYFFSFSSLILLCYR